MMNKFPIGLKVEHKGVQYKIVDFMSLDNGTTYVYDLGEIDGDGELLDVAEEELTAIVAEDCGKVAENTHRTCRRCGHAVVKEKEVDGYPFYCPTCDENMYSFETEARYDLMTDRELVKELAKRFKEYDEKKDEELNILEERPNRDMWSEEEEKEYSELVNEIILCGKELRDMVAFIDGLK